MMVLGFGYVLVVAFELPVARTGYLPSRRVAHDLDSTVPFHQPAHSGIFRERTLN